jgi:hypothetical protein
MGDKLFAGWPPATGKDMLLRGCLSVYIAFDLVNRLWEQHQKLVCAHEHVARQKPG